MGPYLVHPITQKKYHSGQSQKTKLKYSFCQMQGWRRYMQDAAICQLDLGDGNALFGVFDGHGGFQVSKFVQQRFTSILLKNQSYKKQQFAEALTQCFKEMDELIYSIEGQQELLEIRKKYNGNGGLGQAKISYGVGCTANVVLITPTTLIIANAGDSRSVLARNTKSVDLSIDHKPQLQQQLERIRKAGGQIIGGRINGGLNLTRSFGDFNYKQQTKFKYDEQLVISKPDIKQIVRVPGDEFILMGCDGIWEKYVSNSSVLINKIRKSKSIGNDGPTILKDLLDELVASDISEQIGCDNMTTILVQFL